MLFRSRTCVDFVSLALCASLDILHDIAGYSRPPVVSCCELDCTRNPGVSIDRGVMVHFNDRSFIVSPPSDHPSTSFIPRSMDVFEVVWVDPWFERVFILLIRWVVDGGGTRVE